jgi:hypothetical protein
MARIIWANSVRDLFLELPESDRDEILNHLKFLKLFPQMYPVRITGRRFRRHRWFLAGNWLVYYRVASGTIYIRGIWPARIP